MTLTLWCACYTTTPIDLGLHNCELNLSTVVSLIHFTFVYHCVS